MMVLVLNTLIVKKNVQILEQWTALNEVLLQGAIDGCEKNAAWLEVIQSNNKEIMKVLANMQEYVQATETDEVQ